MHQFYLLVFIIYLIGCQTSQEIEDDGGTVPFREPPAVNQINSSQETIVERLDILERDVVRKQGMDATVYSLKQHLDQLQERVNELEKKLRQEKELAQSSKDSTEKNSVASSKKSLLAQAEDYFMEKKWKQAIFAYEEFRKDQPKSSKVPLAILRIGVSFMGLELDKEARVFFEELVDQFPQSKESAEARKFLTNLK